MSKDFEKQISDINKIIAKLENQDNIDEAIALHKECKEMIEKCQSDLKAATQKIEEYKNEESRG